MLAACWECAGALWVGSGHMSMLQMKVKIPVELFSFMIQINGMQRLQGRPDRSRMVIAVCKCSSVITEDWNFYQSESSNWIHFTSIKLGLYACRYKCL